MVVLFRSNSADDAPAPSNRMDRGTNRGEVESREEQHVARYADTDRHAQRRESGSPRCQPALPITRARAVAVHATRNNQARLLASQRRCHRPMWSPLV